MSAQGGPPRTDFLARFQARLHEKVRHSPTVLASPPPPATPRQSLKLAGISIARPFASAQSGGGAAAPCVSFFRGGKCARVARDAF